MPLTGPTTPHPAANHAPAALSVLKDAIYYDTDFSGTADSAEQTAAGALERFAEAGLAVLAPGMWETKARTDAAEAQVRALSAACYANGEEITALRELVAAQELHHLAYVAYTSEKDRLQKNLVVASKRLDAARAAFGPEEGEASAEPSRSDVEDCGAGDLQTGGGTPTDLS